MWGCIRIYNLHCVWWWQCVTYREGLGSINTDGGQGVPSSFEIVCLHTDVVTITSLKEDYRLFSYRWCQVSCIDWQCNSSLVYDMLQLSVKPVTYSCEVNCIPHWLLHASVNFVICDLYVYCRVKTILPHSVAIVQFIVCHPAKFQLSIFNTKGVGMSALLKVHNIQYISGTKDDFSFLWGLPANVPFLRQFICDCSCSQNHR